MAHRLFVPWPIAVVLIGLCLVLSGCGGPKITKANADRVTTGMTEKEVSDILGAPSESAEVEMPDLGGMLGGLPGGGNIPGMPKMPKKTKQLTWKDGDKVIVVVFMDGKVAQKTATGF